MPAPGGVLAGDFGPASLLFNEEAPEPGQASFARTVEAFQLEAQEARDALGRSEAERSLQEGQAAKREADLRHEIIDLRSAQSRERERLRSEAKRLQASLKDAHVRLKAESEARAAATSQVDVLRQQLTAARTESQRKAKEIQEAKAAAEEATLRHTALLQWLCTRCAEALGEGECEPSGAGAAETPCEATARARLEDVLSRLRGRQPRSFPVEAQVNETPQAEPKTKPAPAFPTMRTEARSRVRHAETAQRTLRQELQAEAEARAIESEQYEEELQQLQLRLAALQRAKEASERYVLEEEDTWIRSQEAARRAEAQASQAAAAVSQAEAEAAAATQDAVMALAAQQAAEAGRRRLEAELAELRERARCEEPAPATKPVNQQADWQAVRRREAACIEEAAESQRQVERWRSEVVQLHAALAAEEESVQRLSQRCSVALGAQQEQARADEAKRQMAEKALREQVDALRADGTRSLEQALEAESEMRCAVAGLEDRKRELQQQKELVASLRAEIAEQEAVQADRQRSDEELSTAEHVKAVEAAAAQAATAAAAEFREEIASLHSGYARRLQGLRAECGGQRRAAEVVEDELRQLCAKEMEASKTAQVELRQIFGEELAAARAAQAALREAVEAATAGEVAEASLAKAAALEEKAAVAECRASVQDEVTSELHGLLQAACADLSGDGTALRGVPQRSQELLVELTGTLRDAICHEVQTNPCSSLRRSLCRDLRQELRDQVRSESLSSCRLSRREVSSSRSTTGSRSDRRPACSVTSPKSAAKEELSRRGAALMAAFALAEGDEAGFSPIPMVDGHSERVW